MDRLSMITLTAAKAYTDKSGGGSGTSNYNQLSHKPQINGVELSGNKSSADLEIPTKADLAGKQDVLPVAASGNDVAFNGDIQDGQGNTLSVLAEALTKTASGNPVVITDCAGGKARSLKTVINAIQDLHGYDHPWVGGAGKNKLDSSHGVLHQYTSDASVLRWGYEPITLKAGTYTVSYVKNDNYVLYLVYTDTWESVDLSPDGTSFTISEQREIFIRSALSSGNTEAGFLAKFSNVQLESGSTATSFAPYSNICPISGRTAVVVDDTGKNIFDPNANPNKWLDTDGTIIDDNGSITSQKIIAKQGQTFTVSTASNATLAIGFYDASGNKLSRTAQGNITHVTATAPANTAYCYASRYRGNSDTPQIEEGSVATAYEPYKSLTVTIQLGQTVYGGSVDFTTGVATVDRAIETFDGTENWTKSNGTDTACMRVELQLSTDAKPNTSNDSKVGAISNMFKETTPNNTWGGDEIGFSISTLLSNKVYINVCKTGAQDMNVADWKTFLQSNNMQVCYPLAEPIELTCTPTEVQMLKGHNRVTIDNGTITLDYVAKTDSIQAEVDVLETTKADNADVVDYIENGNTASRAYSANQFILWKGDLYKVTTSIASGATITAGTNVSKTTIGAVLTALLNA